MHTNILIYNGIHNPDHLKKVDFTTSLSLFSGQILRNFLYQTGLRS